MLGTITYVSYEGVAVAFAESIRVNATASHRGAPWEEIDIEVDWIQFRSGIKMSLPPEKPFTFKIRDLDNGLFLKGIEATRFTSGDIRTKDNGDIESIKDAHFNGGMLLHPSYALEEKELLDSMREQKGVSEISDREAETVLEQKNTIKQQLEKAKQGRELVWKPRPTEW